MILTETYDKIVFATKVERKAIGQHYIQFTDTEQQI